VFVDKKASIQIFCCFIENFRVRNETVVDAIENFINGVVTVVVRGFIKIIVHFVPENCVLVSNRVVILPDFL